MLEWWRSSKTKKVSLVVLNDGCHPPDADATKRVQLQSTQPTKPLCITPMLVPQGYNSYDEVERNVVPEEEFSPSNSWDDDDE